jgi:hypothetical protein
MGKGTPRACLLLGLALALMVGMVLESSAFTSQVYRNKQAFSWNGWGYFPDVGVTKYNNVSDAGGYVYDCQGRVIQFNALDGDGHVMFTETIHYVGNKAYNSDGNYVGLAFQGGTDPGTQAAGKENTRAQTRNLVRVITDRSQALLVKGSAQNKVAELKREAQTEQALAMVGGQRMSNPDFGYNLNKEAYRGVAAGEKARQGMGMGVWMAGAFGVNGNDSYSSKYWGENGLVMTGFDYLVSDRLVVGVAAGVEGTYMDTRFYGLKNQAGSLGFTISPYLSWAFFENTIFDLVTGFTFLNNGSTQYAYHDSFRFMISPNVTQYFSVENWKFSGTIGLAYARETSGDYTGESSFGLFSLPKAKDWVAGGKAAPIETCEFRIGGKAGYMFSFMQPYVGVAYLYDVAETQRDPDEVEGTIGIDFFPTESFIISLEAANSFFRYDTYNARFGLNLRYQF